MVGSTTRRSIWTSDTRGSLALPLGVPGTGRPWATGSGCHPIDRWRHLGTNDPGVDGRSLATLTMGVVAMSAPPIPVPTVPEGGVATGRPSRSRYFFALLLLLAGVVVSLSLAMAAASTRDNQAKGFARTDVPGVLVLRVDRPGTYDVFAEGTSCLDYPNCNGLIQPVAVRVTNPGGKRVAVAAWSGSSYYNGGIEAVSVATFKASSIGTYTVAASTGTYTGGRIAVGRPFPGWTAERVGWVPLLLLGGAGGTLAVVTFAQRRRTA